MIEEKNMHLAMRLLHDLDTAKQVLKMMSGTEVSDVIRGFVGPRNRKIALTYVAADKFPGANQENHVLLSVDGVEVDLGELGEFFASQMTQFSGLVVNKIRDLEAGLTKIGVKLA